MNYDLSSLKKLVWALSVTGLLASCGGESTTTDETTDTVEETNVEVSDLPERKAIDLANFDESVSPKDNFYMYVNGNWIKNNPIPASESRWGAFSEVLKGNRAILKEILESTAAMTDAEKGSTEQKVGDFYASGMDTDKIEQEGIKPLQELFDGIAAIEDADGLMTQLSKMHRMGSGGAFNGFVYADMKNSKWNAAYIGQGGLSLPDRSYYLEENFEEKRGQFVEHVSKMFQFMGDDAESATAQANSILELETKLAKVSRTRVEMRNPQKNYNKMAYADVQKSSPNMNWDLYFGAMNISPDSIIVRQPEFFEALSKEVKATSMDTWKSYLRWNVISSFASYVNKDFQEEDFNFFRKTLGGQKEQKERWKTVQGTVNGQIGEELGKLYVAKAFPPEAKQRMEELIANLRGAFTTHIQNLEWMGDETKEKALEKLNAVKYKIGYPDKWKDYSSLEVNRDSYVGNVIRANAFAFDEMTAKLGKEVDPTEWGMTPPTVNAYYSPVMNEIVFPAGILQPPFFDFKADDAVNYGGIGAVIGHELSHGFDDQGSQYAADGNLKNWWSDADKEKFEGKTKVLVDQYAAYTVLDTIHVNGELTLGENIADYGGMTMAYDAFLTAMKKSGKTDKIDGFTPQQRFFINWAQVWRNSYTPEARQRQIKTDPHSPGEFRANGPLTNSQIFFDAFGIEEGDKMRRSADEIPIIW